MNDNSDTYQTTDTSLAAYLVYSGIDLLRIDYDKARRGTFVFPTNDVIDGLVRDFSKGTAEGNIVLFDHTRAKIIDRVKRGY